MTGRAPLLVLVHTVPPLVAEFTRLSSELLPGVAVMHVLDEPLLARIRDRGFTQDDDERLAEHVAEAESVDADAVLVTCSTVSLAVDAIRPRFRIPIVKIDEAMARKAVAIGSRVVVVATNPTTLAPSRALLAAEAAAAGRTVSLSTRIVEGALDALLGGDGETHDRLVAHVVSEAALDADAVVLAQASMARVLRSMGQPAAAPVLASPYLALEQVREMLGSGVGRQRPVLSEVRP